VLEENPGLIEPVELLDGQHWRSRAEHEPAVVINRSPILLQRPDKRSRVFVQGVDVLRKPLRTTPVFYRIYVNTQ
jgi:hypothetical protein